MAEGLPLEDAVRRFPHINRAQRATSIVAVWEFLHGARGAALPRVVRADRRRWLNDQGITPLGLSQRCSLSFQSLLGTEEGPPSLADALLAAECLARRRPIVTSNWRDFVAVPGLRYVIW